MTTKKSILFIAPLPPPVDGQSKASKEALEAFSLIADEIFIINTKRKNLSRALVDQIKRILELIKIYINIVRHRGKSDAIYISLSESFLGNLKDIIIYIILLGNLNKITLHMLGGTGMDKILNHSALLSRLNMLFMKRMHAVVVEGKRGGKIFEKCFKNEDIHVVPNFSDSYLFSKKEELVTKFSKMEPLNILYLSNMLPGKGYLDLLKAFCNLPQTIKKSLTLTFVGGFCDPQSKRDFLSAIKSEPNIRYLGNFIDGKEKRSLYMQSHIFCLPTYYPYEGQPISILEAYATGCAVITTPHAGISDIFTDNHNGYMVKAKDITSISNAIITSHENFFDLKKFAETNLNSAEKLYRPERYREKIIHTLYH